jgi:1-aminocyclopropane-1-carboxylate deaminase/D-cysteine desulfhydrase-like pyridoxal-dependent ACC family enzyme
VRGDELADRPLNPSLAQAAAWGMELDFMDRATWRHRMSAEVLAPLLAKHGPALVVPEGGSNAAGVRGCRPLGRELAESEAELVCVSVGTGGTLAGLAAGLAPRQQAIGYAALGHAPLADEAAALQLAAFGRRTWNWRIDTDHTFGGYGRSTPELRAFAEDFRTRHGISLDISYEAKALHGIFASLGGGAFHRGATVAVILAG